jgi:hypothetical protein
MICPSIILFLPLQLGENNPSHLWGFEPNSDKYLRKCQFVADCVKIDQFENRPVLLFQINGLKTNWTEVQFRNQRFYNRI